MLEQQVFVGGPGGRGNMAYFQNPPHPQQYHAASQMMAQMGYAFPGHQRAYVAQQQGAPAGFCWSNSPVYRTTLKADSKPRLSKDEVDKLEAEFQKNNKPNSVLKKGLAEQLGVEVARINNWFQNRRAKAKQMTKAAEFEAQRNAEKIKSEPASPEVKEYFPSNGQNDALRPSSATMSNCSDMSAASSPSHQSHHSESVFDNVALDQTEKPDMTTAEELHSGYTSPCLELSQPNDVLDAYAHSACDFPALVATSQSPVMSCQVTTEMGMPPAPAYPSFQLSILPSAIDDAHFAELTLKQDGQDVPHPSVESSYSQSSSPVAVTQSPPPMHALDTRIKSPPPIELAVRRRRAGPAHLPIRNASQGQAPVTGMPFGQRGMEPTSPLRRATSAGIYGPQGVRKTPVPPRSPFSTERGQENLAKLFGEHVPALPLSMSVMGPPTPDTPMVMTQQGAREATASSCSSDEDQALYYHHHHPSLVSMMDQNLRTPPATPSNVSGGGSGMYHFTSIDSFVGDEAVLTPHFDSSFPELGGPSFAGNFNNNGSSQPPTPGFVHCPTAVFGDGSQQYIWASTAVCGSGPSSPNARGRQLQFNNMTIETFNARK